MDDLNKTAEAIVSFAWNTDTGMSVACIPWGLLWDLRHALEDSVPPALDRRAHSGQADD